MLSVDVAGTVGDFEIEAAAEVEAGSCLALTGPSGAGKSTLLRMIAGLERPRRGRIAVGSHVLFCSDDGVDLPPERRRCGLLFQEYALFERMPAWKNVAYGVRNRSQKARRATASELLARFGIEHLAEALPRDLSGGERQRVAIARAIATEPEVLLFDEPLSALDVGNRARAARAITTVIADSDVPAVLVTHDFMTAAMIGQTVAVMDRGQIMQRGTADALTAEPATPFVADLTGANVIHGVAAPRGDGLTEVQLGDGRAVVSTDGATGAVALSVQPWEITLAEPTKAAPSASAQNHFEVAIASLVVVGNRVRIALDMAHPIVAEVTPQAVSTMQLRPGARVVASFKASATRLYEV